MGRKTKFQNDWLSLTDENGNIVSVWCIQGKDDFHAFCRFCKKEISTDNGGKAQLLQHAKATKHKNSMKDVFDSNQTKLKTLITASGERGVCLDRPDEADTKFTTGTLWNYSEEEKIICAEIFWVLHVAVNNYTFSSCDGIGDLFSKMFPSSIEAKGMKLSARKISYEISHGLGPYFLNKLSQAVSNCAFFTEIFDDWCHEKNSDGEVVMQWKEIDFYWHKVMTLINQNTQCIKYPCLTRLTKFALCLSHGQAPVERGFSINKRMMSDRSGMNQSTIVGLRLIKDCITRQVTETSITKEMISFYREAHSKYKAELKANESKIKKSDKDINGEPSKIETKDKFKDLKGNGDSAQKLNNESNKRLEIALKRKSFEDVAAAQALIAAGNKKLKAS